MLDLENVFKLIDDGLANGSLTQKNGIRQWRYQLGLHVLSQFGYPMDPFGK
jgi:hypothetical protein